uniref:Uncharacterized protein n=1 Tax=Octopus bimaculoides TaxID=37653 RepID=A0A0L8HH11_OCTBM
MNFSALGLVEYITVIYGKISSFVLREKEVKLIDCLCRTRDTNVSLVAARYNYNVVY